MRFGLLWLLCSVLLRFDFDGLADQVEKASLVLRDALLRLCGVGWLALLFVHLLLFIAKTGTNIMCE